MAEEDDHALPTAKEASIDTAGSRKAWIRYRTELCDRHTHEVLHCVNSEKPEPVKFQRTDYEPTIELVTRYTARDFDAKQGGSEIQTSVPAPIIGAAPSYSLRIYSHAIINALQSVVTYYPGQDLSGTVITINWPYPILVHHYEHLRGFKAMCETKEPKELCVRERHASEHIGLLLRFLDDNIMERVREEEERLQRGFWTYENLWLFYKPGRTIINRNIHTLWRPYVVSSISGGVFENPPTPWLMKGWKLAFDGECMGRIEYEIQTRAFDGEQYMRDDTRFIDDRDNIEDHEAEKLIRNGERYWKLMRKQCKHHKGKSMDFPYNEVR